tara:strand:- start:1185 stop:1400 length:216 start_codon:yes stop_codon:yes gene_type:complete
MLWPGMFDMLNLEKMMSLEWIGQTLASLCWIISVFVYESNVSLWGTGDWLQLAAASSWMVSNLASVVKVDS